MYRQLGLRGADRCVYEDLYRLTAAGERVSVDCLADESGYSRQTVMRSLAALRSKGLVEMDHKNGERARYRIATNGERALSLFRVMLNFLTYSGPEWMERMAVALTAHAIYNDGKRLRRLARAVGGEFQDSVEQWIDETGVLSISQVWEMDEANMMRAQIDDLIAEAQEKLE